MLSLALSPARKWSARRRRWHKCCCGCQFISLQNNHWWWDSPLFPLSLCLCWCSARWVDEGRAALFSDFASRAQLNFALPQRCWISGECRWQFFLLPLFLWETSFFKRGGIGDLRWSGAAWGFGSLIHPKGFCSGNELSQRARVESHSIIFNIHPPVQVL